jgi:hypothetical protein
MMKINHRYDRRGRFARMVLDFSSMQLAFHRASCGTDELDLFLWHNLCASTATSRFHRVNRYALSRGGGSTVKVERSVRAIPLRRAPSHKIGARFTRSR